MFIWKLQYAYREKYPTNIPYLFLSGIMITVTEVITLDTQGLERSNKTE